jgi:hypothetical protein
MNAAAVVGYRPRHADVLEGDWVSGELLCFARNEARQAGAGGTAPAVPVATRPFPSSERLLVVDGRAFIRLVEIEPVHRRARLEIGIQGEFDTAMAASILACAREVAFGPLNLMRVYGWVRPRAAATCAALAGAGFEHELTVPDAMRLDGRPASRMIWGALR